MKKRILSLVLIMMLLLCACGKPNGNKPKVDHHITVSEDTYVLNKDGNGVDKTNTSFNNEDILHLKSTNSSSYTRYIYLKFDISGLKGDNDFSSIELGLTLYQKQEGNKSNAVINIYGCTSNWNGNNVTFNNQPVKYSLVASRNDIKSANTEYTFKVTDYIRKHLNHGETTVAFMLEEASATTPLQLQIYSKEHSSNKAPNLFVSYTKIDNKKYTPSNLEFLPKGLDTIVGNVDITNYKISAKEDTYVSGGDDELGDVSGSNFGSSSILDIKGTGGKKYYRATLLKFDISGYKNKQFERAVLQLECSSADSNDGTDVNIYKCAPNAWKENEVTYNTKPAKGELISTFKSVSKGATVADITDYIKQCLKSNITEISFYIEGTENKRVQFKSNESYEKVPSIILYKQAYYYGTNLNYKNINPWSYAMQMVNDWINRWATIQNTVGSNTSETITKIDSEYANIVGVSRKPAGEDTVYTDYETRIVDTLQDYTYNPNESSLYDKYGGYKGGIQFTATGYYRTEYYQGRWWLIDPDGYPFFSSGMSTVDTGTANQKEVILEKYGTIANWMQSTTDRLYELGFNSGTGSVSSSLDVTRPLSATSGLSVLSTYGKQLGLNNSVSGSTTFVGGVMPVFNPDFVDYADKRIKSIVESKLTNTNIIGWTSDNELHANQNMLDNYLVCDPSIKENIYSYATAWTFMYVMTGKTDISLNDITPEYRNLFKAMVYDRYYNVVTTTLNKYDTNHMFAGCRYLVENFKDEYVMKVSGYYCDVITVNYYGAWTPDAELIANVQKWCNTPFLVTEAYAKGMDVCTEESGLTNESGAGFTCRTQEDRGMFYQNFTLQLLESKYCVGYNWFMYWDNDPTNTNADLSNLNANKGIVNNNHEEYTVLTNYMQQLNLNKYSLINYFDNR